MDRNGGVKEDRKDKEPSRKKSRSKHHDDMRSSSQDVRVRSYRPTSTASSPALGSTDTTRGTEKEKQPSHPSKKKKRRSVALRRTNPGEEQRQSGSLVVIGSGRDTRSASCRDVGEAMNHHLGVGDQDGEAKKKKKKKRSPRDQVQHEEKDKDKGNELTPRDEDVKKLKRQEISPRAAVPKDSGEGESGREKRTKKPTRPKKRQFVSLSKEIRREDLEELLHQQQQQQLDPVSAPSSARSRSFAETDGEDGAESLGRERSVSWDSEGGESFVEQDGDGGNKVQGSGLFKKLGRTSERTLGVVRNTMKRIGSSGHQYERRPSLMVDGVPVDDDERAREQEKYGNEKDKLDAKDKKLQQRSRSSEIAGDGGSDDEDSGLRRVRSMDNQNQSPKSPKGLGTSDSGDKKSRRQLSDEGRLSLPSKLESQTQAATKIASVRLLFLLT